MYLIKAVTNAGTYYWDFEGNRMSPYEADATKFERWQDADAACEKLKREYAGNIFFQRKLAVDVGASPLTPKKYLTHGKAAL